VPLTSRHRLLVGVVALLVLAGVLVPAVLWRIGLGATTQVHAVTGVPDCEGTRPTTVDESHLGETFRRVAIPMVEDFRCTLSIRVDNDSDRTVTLGRMTIPVAGPHAGPAFKATFVNGQAQPDPDATDAYAALDVELAPGESAVVPVVMEFRESGCDSKGGGEHVSPRIRVRSGLATHDLEVSDLPAFLGTEDSSCDS
jgi:hypothetical protein